MLNTDQAGDLQEGFTMWFDQRKGERMLNGGLWGGD